MRCLVFSSMVGMVRGAIARRLFIRVQERFWPVVSRLGALGPRVPGGYAAFQELRTPWGSAAGCSWAAWRTRERWTY